MNMPGVKTTSMVFKFQKMCISRFINELYSHDGKIRDLFGADKFLVKPNPCQTDPYFVSHKSHIWHTRFLDVYNIIFCRVRFGKRWACVQQEFTLLTDDVLKKQHAV